MRWVLRSKIHNATVTSINPDYIGSLTIDEDLAKRAGFLPGEKVLVASYSGARFETYLIFGKESGEICVNGPASNLIKRGEKIIIMGFELTKKEIKPKIILVDENNKPIEQL